MKYIQRFVLTLAFVLGSVFAGHVQAQTAPAAADPRLQDMVLGKADAPVTIIEYASLTCPHCAHFHTDVLPAIKKDYIDTGKVKLIYRDFPLDQLAFAGAVCDCAAALRKPATRTDRVRTKRCIYFMEILRPPTCRGHSMLHDPACNRTLPLSTRIWRAQGALPTRTEK